LIEGTEPPVQYALSPPLTGGEITGHPQVGAITGTEFEQPIPSVTVTVIFVAFGTPVTVQIFPPIFVTVPAVLVTLPELTDTASE
jgi:hypothetical protein